MNMKPKHISIILWVASVIFTLVFVIYQRATGPTYPLNASSILNDTEYRFKLIRTFGGETDAPVKLKIPDSRITGTITLKRFKSYDEWQTFDMVRDGEYLIAMIPEQPPAGKVEYEIRLTDEIATYELTPEPVIIRFKGHVPSWIVLLHVLFIFTAMLLSTRAGMEAFTRGKNLRVYAWLTIITLTIGGLIFGPIMQKYAFGAYWTGWPFQGIDNFGDLTDNKTMFAFIFWVIAVIMLVRNRENRLWAKLAAIVLVLVYLIPHSVLGSEIDYTKVENKPVYENTTEIKAADSLPSDTIIQSDTLSDD